MTNDSDNIAYSPVNEEPRDQQSTSFSLTGHVVDFDAAKPLVVLAAKTQSDRVDSETKYFMEVSKNATVVLLRDRAEVAFDAKYVELGTEMAVFGSVLNDGTMIAERFELWQEDGNVRIGSFE
jgi:hypothetical protein